MIRNVFVSRFFW